MSELTGTIFDIKGFALNDGPGIRTTVFMKGCPLRCLWCHNPEGLSAEPELYVKKAKCVGCGKCLVPCAHPDCRGLGRCLHICPNDCISLCGRRITVPELIEKLLRDRDVFAMSGGGVTISGGEPLMQPEFVSELLFALHKEGINTAIETSSYAAPDVYRKVAGLSDLVIADLKLFDPDEHKKYTGVTNERILYNLRWLLRESGKRCIIRVPLIPGITDTYDNLSCIGEFVGDNPVELLTYNKMAGAKYGSVGRTFMYGEGKPSVTEEIMLGCFKNVSIRR